MDIPDHLVTASKITESGRASLSFLFRDMRRFDYLPYWYQLRITPVSRSGARGAPQLVTVYALRMEPLPELLGFALLIGACVRMRRRRLKLAASS